MPQAYFVSNTSIKQNAKTTFRLLRFFPFQPYKRYDVEAGLTKGALPQRRKLSIMTCPMCLPCWEPSSAAAICSWLESCQPLRACVRTPRLGDKSPWFTLLPSFALKDLRLEQRGEPTFAERGERKLDRFTFGRFVTWYWHHAGSTFQRDFLFEAHSNAQKITTTITNSKNVKINNNENNNVHFYSEVKRKYNNDMDFYGAVRVSTSCAYPRSDVNKQLCKNDSNYICKIIVH